MENPIQFERDGYRLMGVLHQPVERPLKAAVLFLHGFGGNRSEVGRLFVRTARRLGSLGIGSLRFDFVGSGDSEGDDVDCSVESQVVDAVTAYRVLMEQTGLPAEKIGVVGYSLGGCVAALLSARIECPALVLWAPVGNLEELYVRKAGQPSEQLKQLSCFDTGVRLVGREFIQDVFRLRPLEEIGRYPGNLLLIHGDQDVLVPVEDSRMFFEAAHGVAERVEMLVIEGADHVFQLRENSETLIEQTTAWFEDYFPANDG